MRLGPSTSAKVDTVPYLLLAHSMASSGDADIELALTVCVLRPFIDHIKFLVSLGPKLECYRISLDYRIIQGVPCVQT